MSVAYAINRVEHCLPHRRHVRRNALMFEEEMTRELMWKKKREVGIRETYIFSDDKKNEREREHKKVTK